MESFVQGRKYTYISNPEGANWVGLSYTGMVVDQIAHELSLSVESHADKL